MKARGALVGTLSVVLLLSALYPIRQYFAQKGELKKLTAQETQLADRIQELTELRSRLLTDDEIERIAREELGMVRPGEVAFAVLPGADGKGQAGPPSAPTVSTVKPGGESWYERWWGAVINSIAGMR
ncbi:MAG: septum formation initiator family protein [Actinomycetota bacterium]